MERNIQKMTSALLVVALLVAALTGVVGLVAAQETTTTTESTDTTDSYTVNATANETGNASALNVLVNGTDQNYDLIANGSFDTTLANGTTVTFEYVDSSGNVTATADYTVGSGLTTLDINDASIDIDEQLADTGGSGSTGDSSGFSLDGILSHWLTQTIIGALVVYYVFRALQIKGDR